MVALGLTAHGGCGWPWGGVRCGGVPSRGVSMDPQAPTARTASRGGRGGIARNAVIVSVATGVSRVAGLVREVVAASYFGTSGSMSAFTLAFQVPNLLRSLVADAALQSAFVPVFSELVEQGRRREAYGLAAALFGLILAVLGGITVAFVVVAPLVMPLLTGSEFTPGLDDLAAGLSRVLFPTVVLFGLNGLLVGVLNASGHFAVPALAQVVWNVVIIGVLVSLRPVLDGADEVYAYAIAVLAGTVVQFAMALPVLRRVGVPVGISLSWRDPRVGRVLRLMLPVAIGLGMFNFYLLINSVLGSLISEEAPAAIDRAFRIYILPYGVFSLALVTVLFPALSRLAARGDVAGVRETTVDGARSITLVLMASTAALFVLAEPITRLVYERGDFDARSTEQVSEALRWLALALPFAGINSLLTRTFFSLQRPWLPTRLAGLSLAVNVAVSAALYEPLGIAGVVAGTVVANVVTTVGQLRYLARELGGLGLGAAVRDLVVMSVAAVVLAGVAYGVWHTLDEAVGRALLGQLLSVGSGLAAGGAAYAALVVGLDVPEARQLMARLTRRRRS